MANGAEEARFERLIKVFEGSTEATKEHTANLVKIGEELKDIKDDLGSIEERFRDGFTKSIVEDVCTGAEHIAKDIKSSTRAWILGLSATLVGILVTLGFVLNRLDAVAAIVQKLLTN